MEGATDKGMEKFRTVCCECEAEAGRPVTGSSGLCGRHAKALLAGLGVTDMDGTLKRMRAEAAAKGGAK